MGILVVMDDMDFVNEARIELLLEIFSARAASEMERMKNEAALYTSERLLYQSQKME